MKQLSKVLLVGTAAGILSGCPAPGAGNGYSGPPTLTSLGIQDARSLFIAGQGAGQYRTMYGGPQTQALYKVDASGAVSPVEAKFGNNSGYMGMTLNPQFMTQIGENYVVIGTMGWGTYLVRRTDGKSVRLDASHTPMPLAYNYPGGLPPVQADKVGNIYLNSSQEGLFKVALPATLTTDELTKTSVVKGELEFVQQFAVSHDGYMVAMVSPKGPPHSVRTRLYKPNGSVQNISSDQHFGGGMWVAKDGSLYANIHGASGGGLHMLVVDGSGNGTFRPVEGWSESQGSVSPYETPALLPDQSVLLGNETISEPGTPENPSGVQTIKYYLSFIKGVNATKERLTKVPKPLSIGASATQVMVLGVDEDDTTMVASFDPVTKEEKVIFKEPAYQILKMTVAADGTVTVNALRLADNTYVVADIKDGALAVASSELPPVQQFLTLQ